MNRLLLDYQCAVELETAVQLREIFRQVLASSVQEKRLHHKILLCLSEVVTNIARHGKPPASSIRVRFEQTRQHWEMHIFDNGGCFDPAEHESGDLSQVLQELEGGRGIALVRASCDRLDYVAGDEGRDNLTVCSWCNNMQANLPRILVVEDEASSRHLYVHYLSEAYEVYEAANGEEAMQVLAATTIDLVLSDINMPGMDGLNLRLAINQNPDFELIPFVFVTASEDDQLSDRASSLGIDDYLVKPVNRENLLNRIERVLQRNRQVLEQVSNRINRKISEAYTTIDPEKLPHWTISINRRGTGIGGGDLLLSQPVAEGALIALIDTMGHDETAKFFSYAYGGFMSGAMRAEPDQGISGHELLRRLSKTAYDDDLLSKATLTGITCELGPRGTITMASAGHPQPLLVAPGSLRPIPVEGVLPGLLPDIEYAPVEICVKPGERIAIYTDGLVESAGDNQARGRLEQAVMEAIRDTVELPIDRAARYIMQIFDDIAGTPPTDDTTFLLLEPDFYATEVSHAR